MNQKHDIRQQQSALEHKRTSDFFNVRMENVSLGSFNGLSGALVAFIVRLSSGIFKIEIGLKCSYCSTTADYSTRALRFVNGANKHSPATLTRRNCFRSWKIRFYCFVLIRLPSKAQRNVFATLVPQVKHFHFVNRSFPI